MAITTVGPPLQGLVWFGPLNPVRCSGLVYFAPLGRPLPRATPGYRLPSLRDEEPGWVRQFVSLIFDRTWAAGGGGKRLARGVGVGYLLGDDTGF